MTGTLVLIAPSDGTPVLVEAFAQDPVFAYFTGISDPDAQRPMRMRIVRFLTHLHAASGYKIWGWQIDDEIVGCALVVDRTDKAQNWLGLLRLLPLTVDLGLGALSRMNAYAGRSGRGHPKGVSHFIALVGLSDRARGKGIGGCFLQALHAHAGPLAHWALDTENPSNLAFYYKHGYQLYGCDALGPVTIHKLHRPRHRQSDDEDHP